MRKAIDNQITETQLDYLKSNEGRTILLCWVLSLTPNEPHFYPDSPKCIDMRYAKRIRPSIFTSEALKIEEGKMLAKACITCPIMAQAVAKIPTAIK